MNDLKADKAAMTAWGLWAKSWAVLVAFTFISFWANVAFYSGHWMLMLMLCVTWFTSLRQFNRACDIAQAYRIRYTTRAMMVLMQLSRADQATH